MSRPRIRTRRVTGEKNVDKYSNFFITINTNKRPASNTLFRDKLIQQLNALSQYLTGTEEGVRAIIKYVIKGKTRSGIAFPEDTSKSFPANIIDVDSKYQVEVGKHARGGRVHVHILMRVVHRDLIQIRREAIVALTKHFVPVTATGGNPHVHIKVIPGVDDVVKYLTKDTSTAVRVLGVKNHTEAKRIMSQFAHSRPFGE